MADYTALLTAFKTSVNQRITVKNTVDSIDPVDVGGSITDFADAILSALNKINEFNILGGAAAPTLGQGNEDDVYVQYGSNLTFWKKDNNAWVSKVTASFGINIPDGNLNLQYRISGMIVTVSSGSWYIGNVQYQKPVQTQFTVPNANLNFDRIDAVFADKLNEIHYVVGTASADPDNTKPSTPSNEIIVTYVYVPKSSSGQLPYFADSNFSDNGFPTFTSGPSNPDNSSGIDGDVYTEIPVNNSYLKLYQKLSGAWEPVFNLPLASPSGAVKQFAFTETDLTNVSDGFGDLVLPFTGGQISLGLISRSAITEGVPSGALVNNLSGGQVSSYNAISSAAQYGIVYYVGDAIEPEPNTSISGMNFGSASAIQSFLISKGNSGAVIDAYISGPGYEAFRLSGLNYLYSDTFNNQPITSFSSTLIFETIGNNCFYGSSLQSFGVSVKNIGSSAFANCTALTTIGLVGVQTIGVSAFENSTGLNGKTIQIPSIVSPNGLGGSPLNNSIFSGITGLNIVSVPVSFQTNNSGSPDGDLQQVTSNGGTVNYI